MFIEGDLNFINDEKNLTEIYSEDESGSLIFIDNNYDLKNIIFKDLSKPKLNNFILYGGVNFINSNVNLNNIYLKNSKDEDAINIINSKSNLTNIYF